jgi:hypothetical protein
VHLNKILGWIWFTELFWSSERIWVDGNVWFMKNRDEEININWWMMWGGFCLVFHRGRDNSSDLKGDVNCPLGCCSKRNWPFPKKIDEKWRLLFVPFFRNDIVVSGATVVHRMHWVSKTFALLKILAHTR